jgi:hypothetical protein
MSLVVTTLGIMMSVPASLRAQARTGMQLTAEQQEAQAMGMEMSFACSPRRHNLAAGSSHTIERDASSTVQMTGTAVWFRSVEGMFIALEEYDEALEGHCLVLGWFGDALEPGTRPIARLAYREIEAEEMSGEHSFFSWGAIRSASENGVLVVDSGSVTIESFASGTVAGSFELTGFMLDGEGRGIPVRWSGRFSGAEGEVNYE